MRRHTVYLNPNPNPYTACGGVPCSRVGSEHTPHNSGPSVTLRFRERPPGTMCLEDPGSTPGVGTYSISSVNVYQHVQYMPCKRTDHVPHDDSGACPFKAVRASMGRVHR